MRKLKKTVSITHYLEIMETFTKVCQVLAEMMYLC